MISGLAELHLSRETEGHRPPPPESKGRAEQQTRVGATRPAHAVTSGAAYSVYVDWQRNRRVIQKLAETYRTKVFFVWQPAVNYKYDLKYHFLGRSVAPAYVSFCAMAILLAISYFSATDSSRSRLIGLWLSAVCIGPVVFDLINRTHTSAVSRYALAGMPAAFVLTGLALQRIRWNYALPILGLILLAWSPNITLVLRSPWREPYREFGHYIEQKARPGDVIIVDSLPAGVLGIARYVAKDRQMASWVAQLGQRHAPEDIKALIAGYHRVAFVRIHEVGEPPPEELWLRANARLIAEPWKRIRFGEAQELSYFEPLIGHYFLPGPVKW